MQKQTNQTLRLSHLLLHHRAQAHLAVALTPRQIQAAIPAGVVPILLHLVTEKLLHGGRGEDILHPRLPAIALLPVEVTARIPDLILDVRMIVAEAEVEIAGRDVV